MATVTEFITDNYEKNMENRMENKINLVEILQDCPKGMELDCVMYDNLYFDKVDEDCRYPIGCYTIYDGCRTSVNFTEFGEFNNYGTAKCVIFPKGKTTWEGFVPPCQFKEGDILVHTQNQRFIMSIYRKKNAELIIKTHCILWDKEEGLSIDKEICCYPDNTRLATEEEKQKLLDAIKANGYKWNVETMTLEKLINKNKFVVGATITNGKTISKIVSRDVDSYKLEDGNYVFFNEVHNWKLAPNKFDINALKPFDKVLVRDNNEQFWTVDFFGFHGKEFYPFMCVGHYTNQCIPYECNEHLLGTNDDCDEFFKNWE